MYNTVQPARLLSAELVTAAVESEHIYLVIHSSDPEPGHSEAALMQIFG